MHAQRGLWLFLVPSAVVLALVLFYPLAYAVYLSFFNYYLGSKETSFIGLGNYSSLLMDERFWSSLGRTVFIVGSAVTIEFVLGLAIAFGLYRLTFGVRGLNLLLFLPHIVTPVVAALFLRWIFMGRWGLLDGIFIALNLYPPDWLGSPGWARFVVIMGDAWQFTPFMILVLYAGLNTVDQSQIESATDGRRRQLDAARPHHAAGDPAADRLRALDPDHGLLPLLRQHLRADRRAGRAPPPRPSPCTPMPWPSASWRWARPRPWAC